MTQGTETPRPDEPTVKVMAREANEPLDHLVKALHRAVARRRATGMADNEDRI